jgi:hypothetical protein
MPNREPLGLIDHNRPLPPSSPFPSSSSSSSSRKPLKLAPIFTSNSRTPRCPPIPTQENSSPTPHARKRARLDLVTDDDEEEVEKAVEPLKLGQNSSMTGFFNTTGSSSSSESRSRAGKVVEVVVVEPSPEPMRPGWSRRRVRLGVNGGLASNLAALGIRSTCYLCV